MSILNLLSSSSFCIFNKTIAQQYGLNESLMLGELCSEYNYWEEQGKLENGWFFSTTDNVEKNTTLSWRQQKDALTHLQEEGFLKVEVWGMPATRHIYLNVPFLLRKFCEDDSNKLESVESKPVTKSSKKSSKTVKEVKKSEDESATKEPKEIKDSTKYPKDLLNFISRLDYPESLKEILIKWYLEVAKSRVSISQLKDKLIAVTEDCNGDLSQIEQKIKMAYLNGWFGFTFAKSNYAKSSKNSSLCFTPEDKWKNMQDSEVKLSEDPDDVY